MAQTHTLTLRDVFLIQADFFLSHSLTCSNLISDVFALSTYGYEQRNAFSAVAAVIHEMKWLN